MIVAVALDDHYAPWAATLLRSCVVSHPRTQLCFEIFHNESLSSEDQERLACSAGADSSTVRFHLVPNSELSGLPTTESFGTIVWMRFLIPELLQDRARALYLDADTLVMDSLSELWNVPFDMAPIAAVPNVVEPAVRPHVKSMGLEYPGGFFNSGVLLMDLDRMRAERSSEQLFKTALDHRNELIWPDQDALNLVFARRWLRLHPRWNTQNSFWAWEKWAIDVFGRAELNEARARPAIRHFEGPGLAKPWHYLCPYPGHKEYRSTLSRTSWARIPLEGRTPTTRLLKMVPGSVRPQAYALVQKYQRRVKHRIQNRGRHL